MMLSWDKTIRVWDSLLHLVCLGSSCRLNQSSARDISIFHQSLLLRYDIGDGSQTLVYQSGKPMGRRNEGVE